MATLTAQTRNNPTLTAQTRSTTGNSFLLLEDGFYMLLEDGFKIILEQSVPGEILLTPQTKN